MSLEREGNLMRELAEKITLSLEVIGLENLTFGLTNPQQIH